MAVGATSDTYDQLAKPVHRRVMFAGEHTCKVSVSQGLGFRVSIQWRCYVQRFFLCCAGKVELLCAPDELLVRD